VHSISSLLNKEQLNQAERIFLRNYLKANTDFTPYIDGYIRHSVLDNIAADLLLKKAGEQQIALITSMSIPLDPAMLPIIVFLLIRNYPQHYKLIYELTHKLDLKSRKDIVNDPLFTGDYLYFLCKLVKNDLQFVSLVISASKIDSEVISIFSSSSEPEVLFRIANLRHILEENTHVIKLLLNNPYTPDESVALLRQLLVELNQTDIYTPPLDLHTSKETEDHLKTDDPDTNPINVEDNLYIKISKLPVPGKIRLALKGNKSARMYLIRDTNKQVSLSVLENPKITEEEISFIVKNKTTSEDIIRAIAKNKTWSNNYLIVKDMLSNPKTPIDISTAFITKLSVSDLEKLVKSREIPNALKNQAQKIFLAKAGKK
jgi:hypothetical protein